MKHALTSVAFCCAVNCFGQFTLDKAYYSRVIVPEDIYANVPSRFITIDTLIMDNNSSLRFTESGVSMEVKKAFIGKGVFWKGSGSPGKGKGASGTDGANLVLDVVFHKLGQLTIDTRGGQGTTGGNGRAGYTGNSGGRGHNGGNGGNGGNINLRYKGIDFTPVIGRGKRNAIILKYKGGSGGSGGIGGPSGSASRPAYPNSGPPGEHGDKGLDGELTLQGILKTPPRDRSVFQNYRREPDFRILGHATASASKYNLFIEMLSSVAAALNQPNHTTYIHTALKELNASLKLGLILETKKNKSLSVTIQGKTVIKLIEGEMSSEEISNLCEYLKPAIEHKLDSVKLDYDYPEYITDFVLTSIDNSASLLPTEIFKHKLNRSPFGLNYRKDHGEAFQVKGVSVYSQAFKSGLRKGDKILKINGIPTAFLGGGACYKLLELDSGQSILVSVERNGQTFDKTLVGEWPGQVPVFDKMERISNDVLYIRLGQLSSGKARKMRTFITNEGNFNYILLDLRDCPGGLLQEAADIASLFLDRGDSIAKITLLGRASPEYYFGSSDNPVKPKKILILINENTASGAEVIAAALKHNKAAQTVGKPTYGMGDVGQQLHLVYGKYFVRMKIGEIYTPENVAITSAELQPDFPLDDNVDIVQFSLNQLREN